MLLTKFHIAETFNLFFVKLSYALVSGIKGQSLCPQDRQTNIHLPTILLFCILQNSCKNELQHTVPALFGAKWLKQFLFAPSQNSNQHSFVQGWLLS